MAVAGATVPGEAERGARRLGGYHLFADARTRLGIFGFWNVLSNVPFILAVAWGLTAILRKRDRSVPPASRLAYLVLFAGGIMSGLGSAWYHHAPDNATLLWDRMAMAVTFTAFASLIASGSPLAELCSPPW